MIIEKFNNGNPKIIYLDQCVLSKYAKCLCGFDKFQVFRDVCKKIDSETERRNWLIPINTIHLIEMSKYEQTPNKKGNPKEVNSKILSLVKKSELQMVDLNMALELEIIMNFINRPINRQRLFVKYEGVPVPMSFLGIEVKNDSATEEEVVYYRKMLVDFINTYTIDMTYNSDGSKLKQLILNAGIDEDKYIKLEESFCEIRRLTKALFGSVGELEKRKAFFLKYKENRGSDAATKTFTLEAFLDLCGQIENSKRNTLKALPHSVLYYGDTALYQFAMKNSSFRTYIELVLHLYSNKDGRIDENDLKDIHFLSVAVPYCDIVITEKKWANVICDKGLDKEFNTTVSSDLDLLLHE